MPLYEYRCRSCGTEFERKRPMSEMNGPAPCPRCGGNGERMISGFAASNTFVGIAPTKKVFRPPFTPPGDKKPAKG